MSRHVAALLAFLSAPLLVSPAAFSAGPMPSVVSAEWHTWIHDEVAARLAMFAFPRDATRYLSVDGDDAADGVTPATAWRSVAKGAEFLASSDGVDTRELLLRRGDVFHAEIGMIATRAGTRIADYGDPRLPKPRLSGFALRFVPPSGGGRVDGWEQDPSVPDGTVASRVADSIVRWVRQGGDADFESPLARMATVDQVRSTRGSWHFDPVEMRIWVHSRDDTPVDSNLIEACTGTGNGVRIAGDLSIVENLEAIGWGLDTLQQEPIQSRAFGSSRTAIVGCDGFYCFSHAITHWTGASGGSLTIVDCNAGFTSFNPSGETIFNGFAQGGGNDLLIHRSAATRGSLPSVEGGLSSDRARAWYAHATGAFRVGRVVVHDFTIPDHPWGCRDLGHVANAPTATTIDEVGAVAVDVVAEGLLRGAMLAARNALVGARLRFEPVDTPSRALQSFGASGYMVNCSIHVDLAAVVQGPRFAVYNGATNTNAPRIWFSEIRVAQTRDGLDFVIDYDGPNSAPSASVLSTVLVRESDGGAFSCNVGATSSVAANAYVGVLPHMNDTLALTLDAVGPWGEPPPIDAPLVGAAALPPSNVEIDQAGARRVGGTVGPLEPVASACAADLDGDGAVDGADLGTLLLFWGSAASVGDLNGDGVVDGADLGVLLSLWGTCA